MQLNCLKSELTAGIFLVSRAISTKPTLPILEGILFQAFKDILKLTASDLDIGVESCMNCDIVEEGTIVVPGRIFSDIIKKLPEEEIEIHTDSVQSIVITSGHSQITLQCLASEEFPELPKVEENDPLEIPQGLLKNMIRQTIFSIAVDETRPILTGVLMEINESNIRLVALDSYRLALKSGNLEKSYEKKQVVIPGKSLNEIIKVLGEDDRIVNITLTAQHLLLDMGYTRIISRLLNGDFINYRQILPQEFVSKVRLNRKILSDAVERASLMAREGNNNLIKFNIQEDKMIITSNSDIGAVHEEIELFLDGNEIEIAFNAKYFSDVLKCLSDEEIYLNFTSNVSPCVIKPVEGDEFLYLILPVRIYGA